MWSSEGNHEAGVAPSDNELAIPALENHKHF